MNSDLLITFKLKLSGQNLSLNIKYFQLAIYLVITASIIIYIYDTKLLTITNVIRYRLSLDFVHSCIKSLIVRFDFDFVSSLL